MVIRPIWKNLLRYFIIVSSLKGESNRSTRQANILRATFSSFSSVLENTETAMNSSGETAEKYNVIIDSVDYKINNFRETLVSLWQNLLNSDALKWIIDFGTSLIRTINIADGLPAKIALITTGVLALFTATAKLTAGGIANGLSKLVSGFTNIGRFSTFRQGFALIDNMSVTNSTANMNALTASMANLNRTQMMAMVSSKTFASMLQNEALMASLSGHSVALLGNAMKVLTKEQVIQIVSSAKLENTRKALLLQEAGLTAEQSRQVIATGALTVSQQVATTSTNIFAGAVRGLGAAIKANPLGLIITAVMLLIPAFDKLFRSQQTAIDKAKELNDTFKQESDTIKSNMQTIDGLRERYDELAKGISKSGETTILSPADGKLAAGTALKPVIAKAA